MRGEVGLLTRRVVVEGEMEPTCPPGNGNCGEAILRNKDTFGAHIKAFINFIPVVFR